MNNGLMTKPSLRTDISLFTLTDLPKNSSGVRFSLIGNGQKKYDALKKDGFQGIQSFSFLKPGIKQCNNAELGRTAADFALPGNIMKKTKQWKKAGYECATILIGNGWETFEEGCNIAEKVLNAASENEFPIYIELHRGTVTQNIPLTLRLIEKYPELRFNADFSHYVSGYGWDRFFDETIFTAIQPILDRVRYIHGRMSTSRRVQLHKTDDDSDEALFQLLWTKSFQSFLTSARPGDYCCFAPELLPRLTDYSQVRLNSKNFQEEGDRYQEALRLTTVAKECFRNALIAGDVKGFQFKPEKKQVQQGHTTLVHAVDLSDLQELKKKRSQIASQWIRVRLGNGMETPQVQTALIEEFLNWQKEDNSILLETCRGSVTHSVPQTLDFIKSYPQLQLSFNMSEWIINHEIRTDRLLKFYLTVRYLFKNIKLVVKRVSTAQRMDFEMPDFKWKLPSMDITRMTNWTYYRFFLFTWKKIIKLNPSVAIIVPDS
jgi:hypothetical protein